jgi:hypothetical protein
MTKKEYTESHTGSNLVILEANWASSSHPLPMKPITQHITTNVVVMKKHPIFSETFNFAVCQSQKAKVIQYVKIEERRGPNTWAPTSPDLLPHNFFLSAYTVGRT